MRLIVDIPDADRSMTFVLEDGSSVDDAEDVVSHISRHFKNLQVNYKVEDASWDGTMLTSSSDHIAGLDHFECLKQNRTSKAGKNKS